MRISSFILTLVAVAVLGGTGLAFMRTQQVDFSEQTVVEDAFRLLKQLDAELNVLSLKSRFGLDKNYDKLADFNKESLEAVISSSSVVSKGVEDMGQEIVSYALKTAEKNIQTAKKMFAVKSIQDALDLQAEWAKTAFYGFVAESAKLQDMSMEVGTKASEPLSKQVNAAVEKFSKQISA